MLTARVLAHYAEVNALRSELLNMIRAGAVPSVAQLRVATTPKTVGGARQSNEQLRWVGNAVLGLCCKVAGVIALERSPREARLVFDSRSYRLWSSEEWIASRVLRQGLQMAVTPALTLTLN